MLGFQARKLPRGRPSPAEVREHPRVGALPQGLDRLRPRQGSGVDRAGGSRLRRRGQHRCDRVAAGRLRARGRLDGHRAHRPAVEGARAADEAAVARVRRRCRGRDRDAARHGARRTAGIRRQGCRAAGRASTRPTIRRGSNSGSPGRSPICSTACGSSSSVERTAKCRSAPSRRLLDGAPDSPDKARRVVRFVDRPARHDGAASSRQPVPSIRNAASSRVVDARSRARAQRARGCARASRAQAPARTS